MADAFQLAATTASGAVGFMVDVNTGQSCRQGSTFGLLAGLGRGFCSRCQRLEFKLDGGNVSLNRFFDQTDLPRIELFARQKADGWDAWGNEVACDIALTGGEPNVG